jgi:GMP synthase-like glutamine amidotransferase
MHLATLITNTDVSAFAAARPDDAVKFAGMIHGARPDWRVTPFWVCKGEFPEDVSAFDGMMITGSPASVTEGAPWMLRLEALVRAMIAARQPLFGACFGHQIIAQAHGARIVPNPGGWGFGRLPMTRSSPTPWAGPEAQLSLYGAHSEQVAQVPPGARTVFAGPGVPVAGFALGDHVFTVQHHPEMTRDFITDLVAHYSDDLGPEVTARARASLADPADAAAFAHEIARFFEHAAGAGREG